MARARRQASHHDHLLDRRPSTPARSEAMSAPRVRSRSEIAAQRRRRSHSCWDHLIAAPLWPMHGANLGTCSGPATPSAPVSRSPGCPGCRRRWLVATRCAGGPVCTGSGDGRSTGWSGSGSRLRRRGRAGGRGRPVGRPGARPATDGRRAGARTDRDPTGSHGLPGPRGRDPDDRHGRQPECRRGRISGALPPVRTDLTGARSGSTVCPGNGTAARCPDHRRTGRLLG